MKLQDLTHVRGVTKSQKALENFFESKLNFESVSQSKASQLLAKTESLMAEYVEKHGLYDSQNDSKYLQLLMMQEGLKARLEEDLPIDQNDPKLKMAMQKVSNKQALTKDEQDLVGSIAQAAMGESVKLTESEVEEAQTVLAAQDIVDRIAGMLEDVGEMIYKDLPAVVEAIKTELGTDQAGQFQNSVAATLEALNDSLDTAKNELDGAMGIVTGEETMAMPSDIDMELPEPDLGDEDGVDDVADAAEIDLGSEDEEEVELGRERR